MRLPHLLGNSRLKEALASLPPSGVGSAVLLDGPAGIGKRTAAADLAAGLLCPEPNGPCCICPSCKRASAGSHPDLSECAYQYKTTQSSPLNIFLNISIFTAQMQALFHFLDE